MVGDTAILLMNGSPDVLIFAEIVGGVPTVSEVIMVSNLGGNYFPIAFDVQNISNSQFVVQMVDGSQYTIFVFMSLMPIQFSVYRLGDFTD
jgi:hypothetical protein